MKHRIVLLFLAWSMTLGVGAGTPPVEKLLPSDTLMVATIPDAQKLRQVLDRAPQMQFWNDPAMAPFREKFMAKFKAEILEPLEKELGLRYADYKDLAQGQVTFAVTQNGWRGKTNESAGLLFIIDAGEKTDLLKTNLAGLKKKWIDSGREIRTEKIRDVEFSTLVTTDAEIDKTFQKLGSSSAAAASQSRNTNINKLEFTVGQSGSLLIAGNSSKVIEAVLARQSGGLGTTLADDAVYQANRNALFQDANFILWVNLKPLLEVLKSSTEQSDPSTTIMMPKIFTALGLNGLQSVAVTYSEVAGGGLARIFVGTPDASRQGILKLLIADAKDSNPPPFVPADAVKFTRWRLDLQKTFSALEKMMSDINPASTGAIKLIMESAGKDQDENFDLRKELIGNLGDDVIAYEKKPRGITLQDLTSPPTMYLISSASSEKMAHAMKVGLSSLAPEANAVKDREFLGRKIYSFAVPQTTMPVSTNVPASKSLHFAAGNGYVALTTDVSMLEEYLRSTELNGKALADVAGLKEAAHRIGGMTTGLFAYENQGEMMRVAFETLRKNSGNPGLLFGQSTVSAGLAMAENNAFKEWADLSLLPPFEAVAKYFDFTVSTGSADASGFTFQVFSPTPAALRK